MSSTICFKKTYNITDVLKQSQRLLYNDSKKCVSNINISYNDMKDSYILVKNDIDTKYMNEKKIVKKSNDLNDIV